MARVQLGRNLNVPCGPLEVELKTLKLSLVTCFFGSQCCLWYGRACYPTKTTFLQFWCLRCCLFLDQILLRWQDTICTYGLVLISCDFMPCRCTPRIRPGATTVFCISVSSVNHRQNSSGLSAAICRRYAALCRFVAYQLFQWAHHTPVVSWAHYMSGSVKTAWHSTHPYLMLYFLAPLRV